MPIIEQLKTEYRRNEQPHFQPIGATFAVTLMAHDAIPEALLKRVRERRDVVLMEIDQDKLPQKSVRKRGIHERYFQYIEKLLHQQREQEYPFKDSVMAKALEDRLKMYDGKYYDLVAYSIMSNHAHLQVDLSIQCSISEGETETEKLAAYINLATIIGKIKGGATYDANKATGRKGTLWMPGYYDRYMRSQRHLMTEFWYILRNPEKAGLVTNWRDHPFTYGDPNLAGVPFGSL
jgi:hypothetical protein